MIKVMIFVLIWGLFMETTVMGSVLRLVWPLGVSIYSYSYSYNSIWGLSGTQISGQSWVRSSLMANQGLYTTWGGSDCSESSWHTLLPVSLCVFWEFCAIQPYILKGGICGNRIPQTIWNFRRKIVWERKKYQDYTVCRAIDGHFPYLCSVIAINCQ